jgi:hypothetical protein
LHWGSTITIKQGAAQSGSNGRLGVEVIFLSVRS